MKKSNECQYQQLFLYSFCSDHEFVNKGGVGAQELFAAGNPIAELTQQNPPGDIQQHMLTDCQRGEADRESHQQRCCAAQQRDVFLPPNPDPAEPSDKSVDRRKGVVRLIKRV